MRGKDGTTYSVLSIIRLVIVALLFMSVINIIPFFATGKLNSNLLNYSIAISMFFSVVVDVKWIAKKPLEQVGLSFRIKDVAYFACGVMLAIVVCGVFVGIVSVIRMDNLLPTAIKAIISPERSLIAFVVIPFTEEIFHRGYFMGNTFQRLSYWQRSALSAFLFMGKSKYALNAFDNALLDSGIGDYNLVKISSILPANSQKKELVDIPKGAFLHTAYSYCCENMTGIVISAAVALGIPDDNLLPGVIMEFSGKIDKAIAEATVCAMIDQAMDMRGVKHYSIQKTASSMKVEKSHNCVVAAVAIWETADVSRE